MAPLASIAGTYLLAAVFYTLTAHIAVRYVIGSAPIANAAGIGLVLATVSLLLSSYHPLIVMVVSVLVDAAAILVVYDVSRRETAVITVVHYTVSVLLGLALFNLVRLLGTAPT